MKISDFESFLEPVILERGHKLFKKGAVKSLQFADENRILASVSGSQTYSVEIFLEGDDVVKQSSCSCPYDWSETCKHQGAVFFTLREGVAGEEQEAEENTGQDLKHLIMQETKDELVSIILQFARSREAAAVEIRNSGRRNQNCESPDQGLY